MTAAESGLSDREKVILDIASQWFRHAGAREQLIGDRLGISATRFYQELNALIDTERALAYAPVTVHRLLEDRDRRRAARSARQLRAV